MGSTCLISLWFRYQIVHRKAVKMLSSDGMQAVTLRKQLAQATAGAARASPSKMLTAPQLRGYSNKIQQQAGKALDLPFSMVRGEVFADYTIGNLEIPSSRAEKVIKK